MHVTETSVCFTNTADYGANIQCSDESLVDTFFYKNKAAVILDNNF